MEPEGISETNISVSIGNNSSNVSTLLARRCTDTSVERGGQSGVSRRGRDAHAAHVHERSRRRRRCAQSLDPRHLVENAIVDPIPVRTQLSTVRVHTRPHQITSSTQRLHTTVLCTVIHYEINTIVFASHSE